jgi:hypothetical protein
MNLNSNSRNSRPSLRRRLTEALASFFFDEEERRLSLRDRFRMLLCLWSPSFRWRRPGTSRDLLARRTRIASVAVHALIIFGPLILFRLGCVQPYRIPAGGGETVAQKVRVQVKRVKRTRYVVNPLSPIYFTQPKPEDVEFNIDRDTTHAYRPGQVGGRGTGKGPGYGAGVPGGKVRFIRLQYRGGDWDQDMGINADTNILIEFHKRTSIPVFNHTEAIPVSHLRKFPKNQKPPFVYITGSRGIDIRSRDAEILRDYLLKDGGMLFADNGGRHFHSSFSRLMRRVLPDYDFVAIPHDDEIFQTPYLLPDGAPPLWHHSGTEVLGIKYRGRWIVFYHQGDLGDAWKTGHSGTSDESAELAYQTGVNVIQYAIIRYLDHIGAGAQ